MCAPPTAAYQATGSILRAVRYLAILAGSYCCHRHNSKGDLRNPVSSPNATIWAAQVRHPLSILASFVALPAFTSRGEASGQAPLKNRLPCSEQGQFGKAMVRLPSVLTAKRSAMAPEKARNANGQQRTKGTLTLCHWFSLRCLSIDTHSVSLPQLGGESYSRWRVGNNFHTAWHCLSIASCSSSAIHATGTFAGKI